MPDDAYARLQADNTRLAAELEQARTTLEDNEDERVQVLGELQRLRHDLRRRESMQRAAEQTVASLRGNLDTAKASLDTVERAQAQTETVDEELRVVVEELQVLAEELDGANEELQAANQRLADVNRELEARVEAEVSRRETVQTALFRQEKLEALGQLVGGVAHDFNNLLTVVLSGVHMLARATTEERRAQLAGRIEQAVQRGAELTRRLLAFGRRQALRPEPLDLAAQMSELRDLLAHALRGDLRIEARVADGVWPIAVDHGALELALLNLAVNARDAMPHGGLVTLAASNRHVDAAAAPALEVEPGDYVELSVIDRGTGMTPEVLARVFEPFFTTKESGRGSGLGLAQVYGFCQQSGGTARVQSEPGEGCSVTLLLPRSTRPVARPAASAPATATPALDGSTTPTAPRILVVEDDEEVGALMHDLLGQFGYAVHRVSNAAAALGTLSNDWPLDLVLTDILLPGGTNGVDLAHEVAKRRPELPIVLTSGYAGEVIDRLGPTWWPLLRKPFQPETLRATVQAALAGGQRRAAAD